MNTYSHPVIGATLLAATGVALIGNALINSRSRLNDDLDSCSATSVGPELDIFPTIDAHAQGPFIVQRLADGTYLVSFKATEREIESLSLFTHCVLRLGDEGPDKGK